MASFFHLWKANFLARAVLIVWAVLSAFAVVAGPFGTFHVFSLTDRLVFWPTTFAAALILAAGLRAFFQGTLGITRFLVHAPLIAATMALLLTPPLFWMTQQFAGPRVAELYGFWVMALFVFAASISVSAMRHALRRHAAPVAVPALADAGPRLFARLPEQVQAPLLRLSVRDHYVDVTTEAGTHSLLMRLADAIAEAEGIAGARVHRSHWVAAAAVEGVETAAGRHQLLLCDGSRVPVSKTYRDSAQALLAARGVDAGGT
ncbi:MAG: LytTR family transcriptional regulator [Rhodobacteraceae bacterium]|nr:LytTR family transcriptional regulator [Paracoccaceae bacterium]